MRRERHADRHWLLHQKSLLPDFRNLLLEIGKCSVQRTRWQLFTARARPRHNANLFYYCARDLVQFLLQLVHDGSIRQRLFGEIESRVKYTGERYQVGVVLGESCGEQRALPSPGLA